MWCVVDPHLGIELLYPSESPGLSKQAGKHSTATQVKVCRLNLNATLRLQTELLSLTVLKVTRKRYTSAIVNSFNCL